MNRIRLTREATLEEMDSAYGVFDADYVANGAAPQESLVIAQHVEDNIFVDESDCVIYACIRAGQGDEKARTALRRVFGFDAMPVNVPAANDETSPAEPSTDPSTTGG